MELLVVTYVWLCLVVTAILLYQVIRPVIKGQEVKTGSLEANKLAIYVGFAATFFLAAPIILFQIVRVPDFTARFTDSIAEELYS